MPPLKVPTAREPRYDDRDGWRRSAKGNLWCRWPVGHGEELTLTVFPRGEGFSWCIASADGPSYSRDTYASEAEAMAAVMEVV